jgi:hypothetical protein
MRYRSATKAPGKNRPSSGASDEVRKDTLVLRGEDGGADIATVSASL